MQLFKYLYIYTKLDQLDTTRSIKKDKKGKM